MLASLKKRFCLFRHPNDCHGAAHDVAHLFVGAAGFCHLQLRGAKATHLGNGAARYGSDASQRKCITKAVLYGRCKRGTWEIWEHERDETIFINFPRGFWKNRFFEFVHFLYDF